MPSAKTTRLITRFRVTIQTVAKVKLVDPRADFAHPVRVRLELPTLPYSRHTATRKEGSAE